MTKSIILTAGFAIALPHLVAAQTLTPGDTIRVDIARDATPHELTAIVLGTSGSGVAFESFSGVSGTAPWEAVKVRDGLTPPASWIKPTALLLGASLGLAIGVSTAGEVIEPECTLWSGESSWMFPDARTCERWRQSSRADSDAQFLNGFIGMTAGLALGWALSRVVARPRPRWVPLEVTHLSLSHHPAFGMGLRGRVPLMRNRE